MRPCLPPRCCAAQQQWQPGFDAAGEAIRADAGAAGVHDAEWLPKSEVRRRIARAASVLSGAPSRCRYLGLHAIDATPCLLDGVEVDAYAATPRSTIGDGRAPRLRPRRRPRRRHQSDSEPARLAALEVRASRPTRRDRRRASAVSPLAADWLRAPAYVRFAAPRWHRGAPPRGPLLLRRRAAYRLDRHRGW